MKTRYQAIFSIAAVALAAQAAAQVTLYEREGFQGESFTTRRQVSDLGRFGFNDSAASAVVAGEAWERWQVCEDVRFGGRCAILTPGQYPSLQAMGLAHRIASAQAMPRVEPPPVPAARVLPAPIPVQAVFYGQDGFAGRSFAARQDIPDLRRSGFNDRISSIDVQGGPWEVCQDSGYAGRCAVLRAGRYPTLASMGMENRISSLRIVMRDHGPGSDPARLVLFEREGYGGRSMTTRGDEVDLRQTGFDNRVSSLQVYGGPWELCQDGGFGGTCLVLRQGEYPSLRALGLDNRISSARVVGLETQVRGNRADATPAAVYDPRRRGDEPLYLATVTAVRAVVNTPTERCWVEPEQVAKERPRNNIPGAIVGAVLGGILGHQVGDGRGRDLATVGGVIAGGAIGASVGRDGRAAPPVQDVQRCTSVPSQAEPELWDVTYNFRGQEHRVQMTTEPGATITVNRDGEPRV